MLGRNALRAIGALFAAGCLVTAPAGSHGQLLVDWQQTAIARPHGERVKLTILFGPSAQTVDVAVRLLERSAQGAPQYIRAKVAPPAGNASDFVVRQSIKPPAGGGLTTAELVVDFSKLDLPAGGHTVALDIRGSSGGRTLFARVTPSASIDTTPGAVARAAPLAPVERSRQLEVYVGGSDQADGTVPQRRNVQVNEVVPPRPAAESGANLRGRRPDISKSALENTRDSLVATPWVPLSAVTSDQDRTVYFATNRARGPDAADAQPANRQSANAQSARLTFTANRSPDITYGDCLVNVPVRNHHKGDLETPGWFDKPDVARFFAVDAGQVLTPDQLLDAIGHDDLLLFVHGFDNSFEDAILRLAQLRYDIDFPGQVLAFCWPSAGNINKYDDDSKQAAASYKALTSVLEQLLAAPEAKGRKLHIFAHSMGNRIVLNAVYQLRKAAKADQAEKPFGQIVLAAPDVGAAEFNYLVDYLLDGAERVTYYFCELDSALRVSQKINSYQPVGLYPYFERGLDTVCADQMDTSFIGHTYYATSDRVLTDLQLIFTRGLPPPARLPPLAAQNEMFGHSYWSFVASQVASPETPAEQ